MAENHFPNANERTYQEVEYLKKNLGPVLVAALAEICIRRPADPIEYLGHWLLRWRYNEELKRRDVQNALEVVRQKQWDSAQAGQLNQGVTPGYPNLPAGYGGPPEPAVLGEEEEEEGRELIGEDEENEEFEGEDLMMAEIVQRASQGESAEGKRKSSGGHSQRTSHGGTSSAEGARASHGAAEMLEMEGEDGNRASVETNRQSMGSKRSSAAAEGQRESSDKRASDRGASVASAPQ